MEITKILYRKSTDSDKAITECDIVLDDSLKLCGVRLYKKEAGDYYLVFPSKQDVYNSVRQSNPDVNLAIPECTSSERKKKWEEFFFPMNSGLYARILQQVVIGYDLTKSRDNKTYIP